MKDGRLALRGTTSPFVMTILTADQPQGPDMSKRAPRSQRGKIWCKQWLGRHCWINADVSERLGLNRKLVGSLIEALVGGAYEIEDTLKEERRTRVRLVVFADRRWVLKRYQSSRKIMRWYHRFRLTPLWREWKGARRLAASGRRVVVPLALMHDPRHKVMSQGMVYPFVESPTLDHLLRHAMPESAWSPGYRRRRRRIARAIGQQIGSMAASGLVNRDYKPTNLIMDEPAIYEGQEPMLIDAAGVHRRRGDAQVYRALAVLMRSARSVGHISTRDAIACLQGLLDADPSIARRSPRPLRKVVDEVEKLLARQPFSDEVMANDAPQPQYPAPAGG